MTEPTEHEAPTGLTDPTDPASSTLGARGMAAIGGLTERSLAKLDALRGRSRSVDLVMALAERDRDAHGSVLGSAIALRLFLFLAPMTVVVTALIGILRLRSLLEDHLISTPSTGEVAAAVTGASGGSAIGLLISGLLLSLWAGRSLSRVLAASAALSWGLDGAAARLKMSMIAAATGVLVALGLASALLGALRENVGLTLSAATWVLVGGVGGYAMFLLALTLPRPTRDPGAVLPGAIVFGAGFAALQMVMHVYVPNKVARTTDTLGALAGTIAVLGNLFAIGRLFTIGLVVNAVIHERYGSITELVFALPFVRRLPQRFPALVGYFGLAAAEIEAGGTDA